MSSMGNVWRPDPDPKYRNTDHAAWNAVERFIEPFPDDVAPGDTLPKNAWAFIWFFAMRAKWAFFALLVVGGLVGGVDAALYWGVGWLIDILDSAEPATLWANHWHELMAMLVLLLVVRAIVMVGAAIIEQQVIVPRFYTMVRWQAFRKVAEQPYAFFQDDFAGRIATKIMQAGESTGDFIVTTLQSLWSFITFIILTFAVLSALDWRMGLVVAVWFAGYAVVVRYLLPRLRAAGKNNANERAVLNGRLVDIFTNILTVKLFDTGRREHGDVKSALSNYLGAVTHLTRMITTVRGAVAILNGLMMAAVGVIAVGGWMSGTISTGSIAATMGLVFRLNQMSGWMMFNINGLIRAYSTIQDAVETVSVEPSIKDTPDAKALPKGKGHLIFDNVHFNYGKEDIGLFEALSFDIKPGEKVGLVGPSGAGKSTIVSLMLRLFEPEQGRVLFDGYDIAGVTQHSLRAQFGVVSQEPSLMHRSLADNIAYGSPDATMDDVIAAAKKASAHNFILDARDPRGRKGYEAHVGERGIKLSGGQRQRVAIARVMLKDAPVLILDEATSALDSEIEAAIQENLATLMEGKTVLAIAHRLSTIAAMDRLIVIDKGKIVQTGSHADLLKDKKGLYGRLWALQSGGFLPMADAAE